MYGIKQIGRLQEMIEGSYKESHGVEYTVDKDGSMIRIDRKRYQVKAARDLVESETKKS